MPGKDKKLQKTVMEAVLPSEKDCTVPAAGDVG